MRKLLCYLGIAALTGLLAIPTIHAQAEAPATIERPSSGDPLTGLQVGPTAAIGFPFLFNYGVDAIWNRTFGLGFGVGRMQWEFSKDTEVELFNWDIRGRWFPGQKSFLLGAAYGKQGIVAKTKADLELDSADLKVPTALRLEVNTNYLTPHLGWFATWDSGLTLGCELGYQVPLSADAKVETTFDDLSAEEEAEIKGSEEYKKLKTDIEKIGETFGKKAVPYINLIRIGWLF